MALKYSVLLLGSLILSASGCAHHPVRTDDQTTSKSILRANPPLVLPGKAARFDFMEVDSARQRLLAAHKEAGVLEVLDLRSGKVLPPVPVGHVQGIAVGKRVYVLGDDDEHQVVFVDAKTLAITGSVKLDGAVDAVAFDPKSGMVYADEDDGSRVWVINLRKRQLVKTLSIPGSPEVVQYDPRTDRIYQNIKTKDSVVVVDPATQKVEDQWSTLPAIAPHGLVIDHQTGRMFAAGHNGKLVAIDLKTGKLLDEANIAPGTDQIAFDPKDRIIYCASKGSLSAVQETPSGLRALGDTPDHVGAHTLGVDVKRHAIWVSYADRDHSYLQRFDR